MLKINRDIKYLCFVSEHGYKGIKSQEYLDWISAKEEEWKKTNSTISFDIWITNPLPTINILPKTDIHLLTLPRVFKVPSVVDYDKYPDLLQQVSMNCTGNRDELIIAIL